MKKLFRVFLFALLVCTLVFAGLACMGVVQAVSKPSVPDFTVRYNEYPYDIPATQYVDTYTGETITIPGYHCVNRTIEIIIKNPRVSSELCYNVRYKGHYGTSEADDAWQEIFPRAEIDCGLRGGFPAQSSSEYTTLSFPNGELPDYIGDRVGAIGNIGGIITYGAKIDFQVEAMSVTLKEFWNSMGPNVLYHLVEERSGWSGTKTLTIPAYTNEGPNQTEPTPSPTYIQDQPPQTGLTIAGFSLFEFSLGLVLGVVIAGLALALVYKSRIQYAKST